MFQVKKMIIIEKETMFSDDLKIAECMNVYFVNITESLDIKK